KSLYAQRYRSDSAKLRDQGYRVGAVTSWVDALGVGLPAVFLAAVTWLAARMASQGTITVGELVAVYGYVAVLVVPVSSFLEGAYQVSAGLVAARRIVNFLSQEPVLTADGADEAPAGVAVLYDPDSEVRVAPGRWTAIVSDHPVDSSAVIERLARFVDSDVIWGDTRLDAVTLTAVRQRILLADNDAELFDGTLRDVVLGHSRQDDEAIGRALHAAAAEEIVPGLQNGLDSKIAPRGRNISSGQRQRIRLARALLADPEVLMAIDPTSALDAHTEAIVADRLRVARTGRTTVVSTTSALLLAQADTVYFLRGGQVDAIGSHHDLLSQNVLYRRLVAAGADDTTSPAADAAVFNGLSIDPP
ncbi:MAG TPA: ABC transporter ATP-binding protein, partial [Acidothermaceae bacterium]